MKKFSLLLSLLTGFAGIAQKGLDEMIAAEKSFSAYSVAYGTRAAFLKFADTAAIMFENAKPITSQELWRKRKPLPDLLKWWPSHAEISNSGDFGWTCGSWTFQPHRKNKKGLANGHFYTVWKKRNGVWKFILDIGYDNGSIRGSTVNKIAVNKDGASLETMLMAEEAFIKESDCDVFAAHTRWASDSLVSIDDRHGVKSQFTPEPPEKVFCPQTFTLLGSGISPAGDLGYVYGVFCFGDKKDTYIRIWRHELVGWKVALEMLAL